MTAHPTTLPERARNPRGEGSRLRTELVEATSRLLESGDPTAVTLRGVAREAGVAAPSVYTHFADLDEVLLAVVEHHLADLREAVERAAARPGRDRLRTAALAYCRWGVEHPGAYGIVFGGRAVRLLDEAEAVAFADGEALLGLLADLVGTRLGAAAGTEAVEALTLATWTALHGVVSLRTGKPGYAWPRLEAHVDLALRVLPAAGGAS